MGGFKDTFQRYETKYLLEDFQYKAMLERLEGMAEVDEYGQTSILNIYYDTPGYQLIRNSLDKPVYKEKLRLRSYGVPEDDTRAFIEIKKKYEGIVYKRRIGMEYREALAYLNEKKTPTEKSQISSEIDYFKHFYKGLRPAMAISYDRIALAGTKDKELRITFDENIRWRVDHLDLKYGNKGVPILKQGQHLMELKIAGAMSVQMAQILDELQIRQVSFSKYGRGYLDYKYPEGVREAFFQDKKRGHVITDERVLTA
ncbi:polyphosphate polymerase domain-containing protein [Butyrivibrio sp. JL13D10]|uniref:polyphosphate polymerase domain-containing protein n=1 Tax=Butyrivibrio sp. JL13D10 TaxID=3236815 RepID=UPI0038B42861